VSGFRKNLWDNLKNRTFRREYVAENVRTGVAYQIKAMRNARHMSQIDLAEVTGKSQGNIARLENPDYGSFSLKTLLELANAFDVWLSVEFIPFSSGVTRTTNRSPEALNAISFIHDWEGRAESIGTSANTTITIFSSKNLSGSSGINMFAGCQVFQSPSYGAVEERHYLFPAEYKEPLSKKTGAGKSVQLFEQRVS
jgi:transcriptional regulator with XRE-family HTH domain